MFSEFIKEEETKEYFKKLMETLDIEYATKSILPPREDIFNAFKYTKLDDVKVVIIGQDPYPTKGVANGLAFSVRKGVKVPASLKNIYKELERDVGFKIVNHGVLEYWAKQGVLLINQVLTVEEGKPDSHKNIGWKTFTVNLIKYINKNKSNICYMLWGSKASAFEKYIDINKNLVLKSVHPSPLSYYRGFIGCSHFSKANEYLEQNGKERVKWQLPLEI